MLSEEFAIYAAFGTNSGGFGNFSVNRRPPRVGRNPRSGEQVVIPEKLVPHFKPGKALRESVDAQAPVESVDEH